MKIFNRDLKGFKPKNVSDICKLCDEKDGPFDRLVLLMIGVVAGMMVLATIRHNDAKKFTAETCVTSICHFQEVPIIKNGAQYGRVRQGKTIAKDRQAISELAEQQRKLDKILAVER